MKHSGILIIGLALLCAMPILGTLMESEQTQTVRLSQPAPVTVRHY
ncbi:hypothetical protein GCM10011360_24110 [Primorskyibacter flagellatus]|uniref:Uncharacterized protein n=1 Tax=Primorskyibacter flagellatus TaxID=1387277 RepID=A0A917EHF8_9RHOB|nr:hypothetical protein [Primorskyibacter flagellatus]GGE35439.1 hypothetical protein GCM10011360_24110 [Primorskyibacter flagellatus]